MYLLFALYSVRTLEIYSLIQLLLQVHQNNIESLLYLFILVIDTIIEFLPIPGDISVSTCSLPPAARVSLLP